MNRRSFLLAIPLVAACGGGRRKVGTTAEWAPRPGSVESLNQSIREVWFPHQIKSPIKGSDKLYYRYINTDHHQYLIYSTGFKVDAGSLLLSHQWVALPTTHGAKMWYINTVVTENELQMTGLVAKISAELRQVQL